MIDEEEVEEEAKNNTHVSEELKQAASRLDTAFKNTMLRFIAGLKSVVPSSGR